MLLDFVQTDRSLDSQMVESVASSEIVCQCLWMVAVNDLPMFKKGVMMGRMFVNVCVIRWDNMRLRVWVRAFFMFLMMRCSGYTRANKKGVKFLSSFCSMWSPEMIMLYRSACK